MTGPIGVRALNLKLERRRKAWQSERHLSQEGRRLLIGYLLFMLCIGDVFMSLVSFFSVQLKELLEFLARNVAAAAKSLQSCPTLCNPIDGGPPGSPVPGILQARTLEWVAISLSNA